MESLQVVVGRLEELFKTFNDKYYEGKLQKPVITVSPDMTSGAYGWCSAWKAWKKEGHGDDDGFYEINICAEHLNRPFKETCATLLHEMVHLWNLQLEVKDTSRGNSYHNKKFKVEAEQRGLVIEKDDKYGWTLTSLSPEAEEFINSMDDTGFKIYRTKMTKEEKATTKKKSSSRKYVCPCCETIVRATKEVKIICGDCDTLMELEGGEE